MSSDELFPAAEVMSDSPRLKWIKRHGVTVRYNSSAFAPDDCECEPHEAFTGDLASAIEDVAENGSNSTRMAYGKTEDDALHALALANGWRMWNEE